MFRLTHMIIIIFTMCSNNVIDCNQNNFSSPPIHVATVKSPNEDFQEYLEKTALKPLKKESSVVVKLDGVTNLTYVLGNRVNGDILLASESNSQQWSSPQNAELDLIYPINGTGAVISFVRVTVGQTTNKGKAFLLKGGIGHRNILLKVHAYSTYVMNYRIEIFGY